MQNYIIPSLASANQLCLGTEAELVEQKEYSELHLDIEDGNFIHNITFGERTLLSLRNVSPLHFNVHLMVTEPVAFLPLLKKLSPCSVFFHAESTQHIAEVLSLFEENNITAGLAFLPFTALNNYAYLIQRCHSILLMTSEPDGKNQCFIDTMVDKIKKASQDFPQQAIWTDGGISFKRAKTLLSAGVKKVVIGRDFFNNL